MGNINYSNAVPCEQSPMEIEEVTADNSSEPISEQIEAEDVEAESSSKAIFEHSENEDEMESVESYLEVTESGAVEDDGITADYLKLNFFGQTDKLLVDSIDMRKELLNTFAKATSPRPRKKLNQISPPPCPRNPTITNNSKKDKGSDAKGVGVNDKPPKMDLTDLMDILGLFGQAFGGKPDSVSSSIDCTIEDPFKDILMDSVGGLESQKEWLKQFIWKPLKCKDSYNSWNIKPPKGVLFHGPPGCGKTLLARAFGNSLSKDLGKPVKFFHRKGADVLAKEFGQSSQNLRELFKTAVQSKPSIIFFDELDGLCPNRNGNFNEAYNTLVTTLLGLMDTIPPGEVFVFGATNRLEAVDPAMRRPGRFDKHLEFLPPNDEGREKILRINTRNWKASSRPTEPLLKKLSKIAVGYTGADIENLCRSAFFAAFDRHVPDIDLDVGKIDDMKVINEDWTIALRKTSPTNAAINGSTLYTPSLPDKMFLPLVANIQAEIVERLIPILPHCSQSLNVGESTETLTKISTFLMWDNDSLSVDTIDSIILPGVLAHGIIRDYPVYILSQENIQNHPEGSCSEMSYISDTINQALNSLNPCIFYIPRVDDLAKKGNASFIARQLLQFQGKPVLLLATSFCPAQELPRGGNFRNIFSGAGRTSNTNESSSVFENPILTAFLEDTVVKTEGDPIELILAVHDTLLMASKRYFRRADNNERKLLTDVADIIEDYAKTKLMLL